MNWKTAVPQYYFGSGARGTGRMQLLLLTPPMAYKNARLISRQDSEWLGTAQLGPARAEEDPGEPSAVA